MPQPNVQTRLCPHCANSINSDLSSCPYCRADLPQSTEPEWPRKDDDWELSTPPVEKGRLTVKSKAILILGLGVFAVGVYLVGGNRERSDLGPMLEEQQRSLQEKDATINDLKVQLAQLRQEQQGTRSAIEDLRARLQESSNDLVSVQKKLADTNHEVEALAALRNSGTPRPVARSIEQPPPAASAGSLRGRGGVEPGTYESTRTASVYEAPASSSKVVTQISKGTQLNVVRSVGDWVEIRSKHGNPPGYVRADDIAATSRSK
jgi:SH3 domain-containing protein